MPVRVNRKAKLEKQKGMKLILHFMLYDKLLFYKILVAEDAYITILICCLVTKHINAARNVKSFLNKKR